MWRLIAGWTVLMIVFLVLALTVPMGETSKTFTLVMSVLGLIGGGVVAAFLVYERYYGSCLPRFDHMLYSSNNLNALNDLENKVESSKCSLDQKEDLRAQVRSKRARLIASEK